MSDKTEKLKQTLEKYLKFLEKSKKIIAADNNIEGFDMAKIDELLRKLQQITAKANGGAPGGAPTAAAPAPEEKKDWRKLVDEWLSANQGEIMMLTRTGLLSQMRAKIPEILTLKDNVIEWHVQQWGIKNKVRIVALEGVSLKDPLFDISSLGLFDWMQPAFKWLDDNYSQVQMNTYEASIKRMRKAVPDVKEVSDKELKNHIIIWAKQKKYAMFLYDKVPEAGGGGVSVSPEMEKFFAELKKFGSLDYDFSSGKLIFKLEGLSATLGYKAGDAKVTVKADTSEVTVKGEIKVEDKVDLSADITVDYEGKVKGGASIKVSDVFDFFGSKGSVSFAFKGSEEKWSFELTIASSGGKQAHLSRKAAEEIKTTMNEGTKALKEIYNILQEEPLTTDNLSAIKDKVKPLWDKVSKAMDSLSNVVKTPVKGPEVFVTFGVSGDDKTGAALGGSLTFTF